MKAHIARLTSRMATNRAIALAMDIAMLPDMSYEQGTSSVRT